MKTAKEFVSAFLKERGYTHTEEREETYRCKPYDKKSPMYSKPRPDSEGEAEYTHTVKETVVDEFSPEDLSVILMLEQQKVIASADAKIETELKVLREIVSQQANDIHIMRTILLAYAGITLLGIVIMIAGLL